MVTAPARRVLMRSMTERGLSERRALAVVGRYPAEDHAITRVLAPATMHERRRPKTPSPTPVHEPRESDAAYRARCAAAEYVIIERASHQGFHAIHYHVPPCDWTAPDLAAVIELVYQHLPTCEPPWSESGWISQRTRGLNGPLSAPACSVHVARGDYVASVRLPAFPMLALADWLGDRRWDIELYHPIRRSTCEVSHP